MLENKGPEGQPSTNIKLKLINKCPAFPSDSLSQRVLVELSLVGPQQSSSLNTLCWLFPLFCLTFHTASLVFPGATFQINYLHPWPCLKVFFGAPQIETTSVGHLEVFGALQSHNPIDPSSICIRLPMTSHPERSRSGMRKGFRRRF